MATENHHFSRNLPHWLLFSLCHGSQKLVCNQFLHRIVGALTLLWPTSPLNVAVASWGSTLAGFFRKKTALFLFFDLAEAMQQG